METSKVILIYKRRL